jgi:hypothetical protein
VTKIAAALLLSSTVLHATTVIAPTFSALVRQAEVIFDGEATETRSRAIVERGAEKIVTDVTFRVTKMLKGRARPTIVLQFAGGVVGDRGYKVAGVPSFVAGERDVIFAVTSTPQISPVVGVMYGRFRIVDDAAGTGSASVRQFDDTPLRDVAAIGSNEQQPVFSQRPAMALATFEAAVSAEVRRQAGTKKRR